VKFDPERFSTWHFLCDYTYREYALSCHSATCLLVSSGNDNTVRLWSYRLLDDHNKTTLELLHTRTIYSSAYPFLWILSYTTGSFNDVPHDLLYKPGHATLAIACRDGCVVSKLHLLIILIVFSKIYVYPNSNSLKESNGPHLSLPVAPEGAQHSAGAMVWGAGATADYIFASSEHYGTEHTGFHRAFDVHTGKMVYKFDASEAGDAMALDSSGELNSSRILSCNGRSL